MKKTILGIAISTAFLSSVADAKVTQATLYPNGGVLTWSEKVSVNKGSGVITLSGLPSTLDERTLQAQLEADSDIVIQQVSLSNEEHKAEASKEYQTLVKERLAVLTTLSLAQYMLDVEENQVEFTTQISRNPSEELAAEDVKGVAESLREIRAKAYKEKHLLEQKIKELSEEKDLLDRKIQDLVRTGKTSKTVKISYVSEDTGDVDANIQFRVPTVGWRSDYNARLDSDRKTVAIEHKAVIRQQSGLDWENVDLSFSTIAPSKGASLPQAYSWEIHRQKPAPEVRGAVYLDSHGSNEMMKGGLVMSAGRPDMVNIGSKTQSYKVSGKVDLESQSGDQVMVIDTHYLKADLKTHFMPSVNDNGYVIAHATYEGAVSLPRAQVTLYRDSQMVGPWSMPAIKPGEDVEIGFGVDNRVSLKTIVEKDERGTQGVVSKENTWESLKRYVVTNHYPDTVDVRVIDRLPVSRHEDIKVTHFSISRPYLNKYDDKEGVIAWDRSLKAGEEVSLSAGFEIEVPEDQDI